MLRMLTLAGCCLLGACGTNSYCLGEKDYQKAQVVPELQPVEGLALPTTGSALRLPEPPENPQPFGVEDEDGIGVCLDAPPRRVVRNDPASS